MANEELWHGDCKNIVLKLESVKDFSGYDYF